MEDKVVEQTKTHQEENKFSMIRIQAEELGNKDTNKQTRGDAVSVSATSFYEHVKHLLYAFVRVSSVLVNVLVLSCCSGNKVTNKHMHTRRTWKQRNKQTNKHIYFRRTWKQTNK